MKSGHRVFAIICSCWHLLRLPEHWSLDLQRSVHVLTFWASPHLHLLGPLGILWLLWLETPWMRIKKLRGKKGKSKHKGKYINSYFKTKNAFWLYFQIQWNNEDWFTLVPKTNKNGQKYIFFKFSYQTSGSEGYWKIGFPGRQKTNKVSTWAL